MRKAGLFMCRYCILLLCVVASECRIKITEPMLASIRREGKEADEAAGNLFLDHPLIQLCIPNVSTPADPLYIMDMMDWLHTGWRLRCQFIEPKRRLDIGGMLITSNPIRSHKERLHLSDADLDPSNKQSYDGMLKVCNPCKYTPPPPPQTCPVSTSRCLISSKCMRFSTWTQMGRRNVTVPLTLKRLDTSVTTCWLMQGTMAPSCMWRLFIVICAYLSFMTGCHGTSSRMQYSASCS